MRSILAVTIAAILIAGGLTALGTAVANADNPYDPALKRPPLPGRTMTVPRRPCATPQDYDWCFWDARRATPATFIDENGVEQFVTDENGVQALEHNVSYWAYTQPGPNEGVQRVCITYLDWRFNKQFGGCALQSTPVD